MTSDPKGSSQQGVAGGRRKRPAITIEATATEVTDAPASQPEAADSTPAAPAGPTGSASASAAIAEHAELAAAPPLDRGGEPGAPSDSALPPPPPPPPPAGGERPSEVARDWTVLGVAGALVVLLMVAGLWLAEIGRAAGRGRGGMTVD